MVEGQSALQIQVMSEERLKEHYFWLTPNEIMALGDSHQKLLETCDMLMGNLVVLDQTDNT